MKNIQGTDKDLTLFDEKGKMIYEFYKTSVGLSYEITYDSNGNELIFKNSNGFWCETTFDSNGNELTYKDSYGITRGDITYEKL